MDNVFKRWFKPQEKKKDPDLQTPEGRILHHQKKVAKYKTKLKEMRKEGTAGTERYNDMFTAMHYHKHLIKILGA